MCDKKNVEGLQGPVVTSDGLAQMMDKLNNESEDITLSVVEESDIDRIKDLTHVFNLCQMKKNMIRVSKLNGLLDTVSDKIIDRFERCPENFTNAELLNYLQVTQTAIDKANKSLGVVDETLPISITQNNINVGVVETIDQESRDRILSVLESIMSNDDEDGIITIDEEAD